MAFNPGRYSRYSDSHAGPFRHAARVSHANLVFHIRRLWQHRLLVAFSIGFVAIAGTALTYAARTDSSDSADSIALQNPSSDHAGTASAMPDDAEANEPYSKKPYSKKPCPRCVQYAEEIAVATAKNKADRTKAGFHQAHRWTANYIVSTKQHLRANEEMNRLRFHLQHSLQLTDPSSTVACATIEIAFGNFEKGLRLLQLIQADRPDVLLTIARLNIVLGHSEESRDALASALDHYLQACSSNPDDVDSSIGLFETHLMMEQFDQAKQVLRKLAKMSNAALPETRERLRRLRIAEKPGQDDADRPITLICGAGEAKKLASLMQATVAAWETSACDSSADFQSMPNDGDRLGTPSLESQLQFQFVKSANETN